METISTTKTWIPYFPFPECRPAQAEALDFVVQHFHTTDDFFIEAAGGIGKSGIAVALARWLAALGRQTYISTTTVELENQYIRDFFKLGLRQLHSKSRYACNDYQRCDIGSAAQCRSKVCAYQLAQKAFLTSRTSICNAAYLLTCARHVEDWPTRDLAIFDEAHALHETIAGSYSISIPHYNVSHLPDEGCEIEWLQECYAPELTAQVRNLEEQLEDTDREDPELGRTVKQLEAQNRRLHNISKLLEDDSSEWIFDHQSDQLNILPLWGKRLAQELLPRIGQKRIFLSATLRDAKRQARYLGIDPRKAVAISLPSPFPVKNRLIHVLPVVRWGWPDQTPAIEQVCVLLARILKRHPDERGLVHVSSYFQARSIIARMRNPRLLVHENSQDKPEIMARFRATPGAVLVSPSSHEGLDLYGDLSRFQVIAKLPFPSKGDKRTQRRMATDPGWYALHTAQKLIQSVARSVRSENDFAVTYLLDSKFMDFYEDFGRLLPRYFREALRKGLKI
jgi:ATP-dependent DNA helicase DinG